MARKKKVEKTRSEIMVEVLTKLADWRETYNSLNSNAKWKALHDFSEGLKLDLDHLYQDASKHLDVSDQLVLKGTIENWFPEESKFVVWFFHEFAEYVAESWRREKERGKS